MNEKLLAHLAARGIEASAVRIDAAVAYATEIEAVYRDLTPGDLDFVVNAYSVSGLNLI